MKKLLLSVILIFIIFYFAWHFFSIIQTKNLKDYGEFPVYPLTDLSGNPYDFDNNKIKLITFFYSKCPDICPLTINDLIKLHEELKNKDLLEEVDILTISIDPEYDTDNVLKEYAKSFHAPSDHWYFLRGSDENITNITDELGFYREELGGYWSHSTTIYLVDYQNKKRSFHHMTTPKEPLDTQKITRDILLLKREHNRESK